MSLTGPLEVYRQFQSFLINAEYGRLAEVTDMDGYAEDCVGLTGWTTGLQTAAQLPGEHRLPPDRHGLH